MSLNQGVPAGAVPAPTALPLNIASLLRVALVAVGAWLVQSGYLKADDAPQFIGGGLVLVAIVWNFVKNRRVTSALTDALASPSVAVLPGPKMTGLGALLTALAVIGALGPVLSACNTPSLVPPSAAVVVAQGDTGIDLAYNVVAKEYLKQLPTMPGSVKARAKPILVKLYGLVSTIDTAEALGNSTAVASQIADAGKLLAQAKSLLGVK